MQNAYLSPKQVAETLSVSVKTVWNWIEAGRLRAYRLGGGRTLRISRADLDAFMVSCEEKPADGSST